MQRAITCDCGFSMQCVMLLLLNVLLHSDVYCVAAVLRCVICSAVLCSHGSLGRQVELRSLRGNIVQQRVLADYLVVRVLIFTLFYIFTLRR